MMPLKELDLLTKKLHSTSLKEQVRHSKQQDGCCLEQRQKTGGRVTVISSDLQLP